MALSNQEISQKVHQYIVNEFYSGDPNDLKQDTQLLASGILDSISVLQMVDYLEKEFGIEFQAHEVDQDNLNSIDALTTFIRTKTS